jgi:hypothetical protein
MPAAAAPPTAAAQWYGAPTVPTAAPPRAPAYGDPYAHRGAGAASSSAGLAGGHDAGGYDGYLTDPLGAYSPPAYQPQVPAPYAEPVYQGQPALGAPYDDGYPQHAYGPAEPVAYPDGYGAGYPADYEEGRGGDPYGGYATYPPQG